MFAEVLIVVSVLVHVLVELYCEYRFEYSLNLLLLHTLLLSLAHTLCVVPASTLTAFTITDSDQKYFSSLSVTKCDTRFTTHHHT